MDFYGNIGRLVVASVLILKVHYHLGGASGMSVDVPGHYRNHYCDNLTLCEPSFVNCEEDTNHTCGDCDEINYWDGYACVYCSGPDIWHKDELYCTYYHEDFPTLLWGVLLIGIPLAVVVGTCIGVSICCVKCAGCPFYRKKSHIAVSANVGPAAMVGYDAYGRPLVMAGNQISGSPLQLEVPSNNRAPSQLQTKLDPVPAPKGQDSLVVDAPSTATTTNRANI